MVRIGGGDGAAPPSISTGATKKYRMELYLQAFNLLNHTNLGVFNGVETSPYFAQATSAQGPRRFEVGLRFNFLATPVLRHTFSFPCVLGKISAFSALWL